MLGQGFHSDSDFIFNFLGSDAANGFKDWNNKSKKPDQTNPEAEEKTKSCGCPEPKKKITKELFSTQMALTSIVAVYPDGRRETIWVNPNVNSIHGHIPLR